MSNSDMFKKIMLKRQEEKLLYDKQVLINEDAYNFRELLLFDNTVRLGLPEEFEIMSEQWAIAKYPYTNRPEIIYSNPNGEITVTFDLTETEVTDQDLPNFILGMRSSIKKLNPSNTFYDIKTKERAAWFDFRSYAIDGKLYNIIFAVNVNSRLLLGSFSCPFQQKSNYELFAERIILSITPSENEVTNDEFC